MYLLEENGLSRYEDRLLEVFNENLCTPIVCGSIMNIIESPEGFKRELKTCNSNVKEANNKQQIYNNINFLRNYINQNKYFKDNSLLYEDFNENIRFKNLNLIDNYDISREIFSMIDTNKNNIYDIIMSGNQQSNNQINSLID